MKPEQFVFWLKGFLLSCGADYGINPSQAKMIEEELAKVVFTPQLSAYNYQPFTWPLGGVQYCSNSAIANSGSFV